MEITNKDALSCSNYLANLSSPPSLHPYRVCFLYFFILKIRAIIIVAGLQTTYK